MGTESIINFIRIDDRIGTGGQPTSHQLRCAREEGYEAVVNLAPHDPENHALSDEENIVRSLGMEYHHIPVEWSKPTRADFAEFAEVMERLNDRKVLVHCAANFRVTAFFSLYAMKYRGWSPEQADRLISKIWESRPDYRMDAVWRSFIGEIRNSD